MGRFSLSFALFFLSLSGCNTVDLGDNFTPPETRVSEDIFFCRIQPEILSQYHCSGGGPGESGSCHSSRSALRLVETTDPVPCTGNMVTATVPSSYRSNFEASRFTIQNDPLTSPFYRRPTGLDTHPRVIFPESDPSAKLVSDWISGTLR